MTQKASWIIPERSFLWVTKFAVFLYRVIGTRISFLFLYPIVTYFFLTDKKGRKSSIQYLNRVYNTPEGRKNFKRPPGLRECYQHFYEYAAVLIDRFGFWSGRYFNFRFNWDGKEHFANNLNSGFFVLGSHMGTLDIMRIQVREFQLSKIKVLMFTGNAQQITRVLTSINKEAAEDIYPLESVSPSTIFDLEEELKNHTKIGIMGDRTSADTKGRVIEVPFLGELAPFPVGPFLLMGLLKSPVYMLFCLRTKKNEYDVFVRPFSDTIHLPRKNREENLKQYLTDYAKHLEYFCCRYPYQWFNFYDFWENKTS